LQNNTHYTSELCDWSLERHANFIYASSAATYGDAAGGFDDDPTRLESLVPLNMYGFSKHLFDLHAARAGLLEHIVGLKFFNVFGPNEYHKGDMMSVVCKAHRQILRTGELELFQSHKPEFADGEQQRDFVYVKDAAAVIAWLVGAPQVHGLFNLGTGQSRSWNALAQAVFSAMKRPPNIRYVPMPDAIRDRYQYYTQASMAQLTAAGCPVKFSSLEDSVADYVTQYLERDEATPTTAWVRSRVLLVERLQARELREQRVGHIGARRRHGGPKHEELLLGIVRRGDRKTIAKE
jgi:ADP-L-glycero-D-manno-heptose 6-epimerase